MQLHLVLPGLLWPDKIFHDAVFDLDLPALAWLLGRGHLAWQPPCAPEAALCQAFGIDDEQPPYAALRRLGEQSADADANAADQHTDHYWICADPVHLSIEKRRMTLGENTAPASSEELQAIAAALQPLLAECEYADTLGIRAFHPAAAGHAYLQLARLPAIDTTPPSLASGYESLQPQGAEAGPWRRLLNHVQMLLHALPCNAQRSARNLPPLNSLWLWGAGRLPASNPTALDCTAAHGDHPLLAGLARWGGIPHQANLPTSPAALLATGNGGKHLLLLDHLHAAARRYDMLQWRDTLQTLERDWLQPLQQAVADGRLQQLRISALGDEARLDIRLTHHSRWQFWRRPLPPHRLVQPC
ncbi:conserved protein of unknown function [Sterolibacterium denitrificans]|uniref:Phosphoglycerate mutase n=1 Tax=Sterolibacterium denitrificans TaxID=157592 RepID=A0A7Z7HR69_9PROT|nr:hypothetical protein [Sterolibacterium denitrificans]SMB26824.1 conserved protein of unknown function [Sterolibacterium denitrificans]